MLRNLLKITFRNLKHDKGYTAINIFGLTIGITCSLFLLLYIIDELSYDRYHNNADNIYRVVTHVVEQDDEYTRPMVQIPLATELGSKHAAVKNAVRFFTSGRELFQFEEKKFYEERFYYADSSVFQIFTFDFLYGSPVTAMQEPFSLVLTESYAIKYFGSTDAIGKSLTFIDREEQYKVTGVIRDVPHNSHFHFDALMSLNSLPFFRTQQHNWGRLAVSTYLELADGNDPQQFKTALDQVVTEHVAPIFEKKGIQVDYQLQRITDIHLHSKLQDEEEVGGDISFVYILSAIAAFMLIIACINYMNLVTARSARRAKEVGIRKVMGSFRGQLILQFMAEALLITALSIVLSLLLMYLILPAFNYLAGKHLDFNSLFDPVIMLALGGIFIFVGIAGGSYPAFYLSAFNPAVVLKSGAFRSGGNTFIRKTLVVVQFSISIFMLISTLVVYDQLEFLLSKDLGFDKEQLVRIAVDDGDMRQSLGVFRNKLTGDPEVTTVATASATPGENVRKGVVQVEDNEGKMTERGVDFFMADHDFVNALGMTMATGRNFSREILSDTLQAVLVNESMVKRLGWKIPVGKRFQAQGPARVVIGVIKDYHQTSLYNAIEPLVVIFNKNNYYTYIKLNTADLRAAIARIEKAWSEVYPGKPFEYQFLDDSLQAQYDVDERRSSIFTVFSVLTIIIACLGLLGLTAFTTEQRTKEIGIRKVNGASTVSIILLISKEFIFLVVLSAFIAFPAAYYFLDQWLQDFAYRIELSDKGFIFLLAIAAALAVSVITVSYHSIKATMTNPVDSLRSE